MLLTCAFCEPNSTYLTKHYKASLESTFCLSSFLQIQLPLLVRTTLLTKLAKKKRYKYLGYKKMFDLETNLSKVEDSVLGNINMSQFWRKMRSNKRTPIAQRILYSGLAHAIGFLTVLQCVWQCPRPHSIIWSKIVVSLCNLLRLWDYLLQFNCKRLFSFF